MKQIPVGAKGRFELVVRPEHLANQFKDTALPPVLATPVMIMVMENAALNALKPYLDAGESAVGTRVDVRHLAPTPLGMRVVGEAEVTDVDGRRIEFTVRATESSGIDVLPATTATIRLHSVQSSGTASEALQAVLASRGRPSPKGRRGPNHARFRRFKSPAGSPADGNGATNCT